MGLLKLLRSLKKNEKEARILVLGLDNSGKTTILYRMKLGVVVNSIPTIGFNIETVKHKGVEFHCWDVGGTNHMKQLRRHYYDNT